jgi:Raf kinase inhibitor-like YbhB/YbcL family protein
MKNLLAFVFFIGTAWADNPNPPLEILSPAFENGKIIPPIYTCEGKNISPPLIWKNIPKNTHSLALIVSDPDAPSKDWTHWVLYNLPTDENQLKENENIPQDETGSNSWQSQNYQGPCPPTGTHRYVFTLYALDSPVSLAKNPNAKQVRNAIKKHILSTAVLIGVYAKKK